MTSTDSYIQIYSDSMKEIVSCDKLNFDSEETAFSFDSFEIPCKKFAAIKMFNSKYQHTIDIKCDAIGDHQLSFKLSGLEPYVTAEPETNLFEIPTWGKVAASFTDYLNMTDMIA